MSKTDNYKRPSGWIGFGRGTSAGVAGYVVGPVDKGADYQSLADAIAQAAADGTTEPVFYCLTGGDYTANVTLPLRASLIGVDGTVNITGTVSMSGQAGDVVHVENVIFQANGADALNGDYAGSGGAAQLNLSNVDFIVTGGGRGLAVSAVIVRATGQVTFNLNDGVGVELKAGDDFQFEGTSLNAQKLIALSQHNDDVLVDMVDGDDPGSTNQVACRIDDLRLNLIANGRGLRVNNANTALNANAGIELGDVDFTSPAAGTGVFLEVLAGDEAHSVGRIGGFTDAATVVDCRSPGASVLVSEVGFPATAAKGSWRLVNLHAGTVVIDGGTASGGDGALLHLDGTNGDAINLTVNDLTHLTSEGGAALTSAQLEAGQSALFRDCRFRFTGPAAGTAKFTIIGAGATLPTFRWEDCNIEGNNDAIIEASNAGLALAGTYVRQNTNTAPCVRISTAIVVGTSLIWHGSNTLSKPAGGGAPDGFALWLVNDTRLTLTEDGLLAIDAPVDEQFAFQAGGDGGPIALVTTVPPITVCKGFQSTSAIAQIVGVNGQQGVPSQYPGLHVVTTMTRTIIAGGGNDSAGFTFTNEVTGQSATALGFGDPLAGLDCEQLATSAPVLVGPGQPVTLACTAAVTPGASTDVQIEAA